MNRDDIIRMAREAGMLAVSFNRTSGDTELSAYTPELERFAALVAAAEREELLKLCELPEYSHQYVHTFKRVIRARGQA